MKKKVEKTAEEKKLQKEKAHVKRIEKAKKKFLTRLAQEIELIHKLPTLHQ
jgi:hypothetical protein